MVTKLLLLAPLLVQAWGAAFVGTPVYQAWSISDQNYVSAGLGQLGQVNSSDSELVSLWTVRPVPCQEAKEHFVAQPGGMMPRSMYIPFLGGRAGGWWADAASASVQEFPPHENALAACSSLSWDSVRAAAASAEHEDSYGSFVSTLLVGSVSYALREADSQHHRVPRPRTATAQVQLVAARQRGSAAAAARQEQNSVKFEISGSTCILNDGAAPPSAVVGDLALTLCISHTYNDCTPWAGMLAINLTDGSLPWSNRPSVPQFPSGVVPVDNASSCWRSNSFGGGHPVPLWGPFVLFTLVQMQAPVHVFDANLGRSALQVQLNVTSVSPEQGQGASWPQLVPPVLHSSLVPLPVPGSTDASKRRVYTYSAEGSFLAMDFEAGGAGGVAGSKAWSVNVVDTPAGGVPPWAWGVSSYSSPNQQVPVWPTPDATDVHVLRLAEGATLLGVGYTWDLMQQKMNWGTAREHPGRTANGDGRFVRNGTAVVLAECCGEGGVCHTQQVLRQQCNFGSCVVRLYGPGEAPGGKAATNVPHVLLQTPVGGSVLFPLPNVCSAGTPAAVTQPVPFLYPGTAAGIVGPPVVFPVPATVASSSNTPALYRAAAVSLLDGAVHAADKLSPQDGAWQPAWRAQADSGCAYVAAPPALVERKFVQSFVPQVGFCQAASLLIAVQVCQSAFATQDGRGRRAGINRRVQVHFICPINGQRAWAGNEAHQATDGALNPHQQASARRLPGWMDLANATTQWHPIQAVVTSGYRMDRNNTENGVPLSLVLSSSNGTVVVFNALAGMPTAPAGSSTAQQLFLWSSRSAVGIVHIRSVDAPQIVQWGVISPPVAMETSAAAVGGPVLLRAGMTPNGPMVVGQEVVTGHFVSFTGTPPYEAYSLARGALYFAANIGDLMASTERSTMAQGILHGAPYGTNMYSSSSELSTVASSTTGSGSQGNSYFGTSSHQVDDLYAAGTRRNSQPFKGTSCSRNGGLNIDFAAHRNVQYRAALVHGCSSVWLSVAAGQMFVSVGHKIFASDVPFTSQMTTGSSNGRYERALEADAGDEQDHGKLDDAGLEASPRRLSRVLPYNVVLPDCIPQALSGGLLLRPDLDRIFYSCVYMSGETVGLRVTALHMFSGRPAWTVRSAIKLPPAADHSEQQRRNLAQMRPCIVSNATKCVGVQYLPAVSAPLLSEQGSALSDASYTRVASEKDLRHPEPISRDAHVHALHGSVVSVVASDGTAVQVDAVSGAVLWRTTPADRLQVFHDILREGYVQHASYAPSVRAIPEPGTPGLLVASVRAGAVSIVNATSSGVSATSGGTGQTAEQKKLQSASTFVIIACGALAFMLTAIFVYAVCKVRAQRRAASAMANSVGRRTKVPTNSSKSINGGGVDDVGVLDRVRDKFQGWADTQQMVSAVVHPAFNIYGAANLIFGASAASVLKGIDESGWGASTESAFIDLGGAFSSSSEAAVDREAQHLAGGSDSSEKQFDLILTLTFAQMGLAVFHFVVHLYFFYVAVSASVRHDHRVCTTRLGSRYQALSLANGNFSLGMWPLGIFNTIVLMLAFDRTTGAYIALLGSILSWAGSLVVPAAVDPRTARSTATPAVASSPASPQRTTSVGAGAASAAMAPLETDVDVEGKRSFTIEKPELQSEAAVTVSEHRLAENCIPNVCNWSQEHHWVITAAARGWLGLWFVALWMLVLPLLGLLLQLTTGFNGNRFTYKLLQFGIRVPFWLQAVGNINMQGDIPNRTGLFSASRSVQGLVTSAFVIHCIVLLLTLWPITQFAWTFFVPVCPTWVCSPFCLRRNKLRALEAMHSISQASKLRLRQPLLGRDAASGQQSPEGTSVLPTAASVPPSHGMCIPGSDAMSPCCGCMGAPSALAWWLLLAALHLVPVVLTTLALATPFPVDGPTDDAGDFGVAVGQLETETGHDYELFWMVGSSFGPLKPTDLDVDFYWEDRHPLWPAINSAWFVAIALQYVVLLPMALLIALLVVHFMVHMLCIAYSNVAAVLIFFVLVPVRAFWVYILQPIVDPPENNEVMSPQRHDDAWCGSVRVARGIPDPYGWWKGAPVGFRWLPLMPQMLYLLTCGRRDELHLAALASTTTASLEPTVTLSPTPTSSPSNLDQPAASAPAAAGSGGGTQTSSTEHGWRHHARAHNSQFVLLAATAGAGTTGAVVSLEQARVLQAAGLVLPHQRTLSSSAVL